jgi:hypothetical protein
MANYTFSSLTSAVAGLSTTAYSVGSSTLNVAITVTNGTISVVNLGGLNITSARPGALTGRRPGVGQLYPRFNK